MSCDKGNGTNYTKVKCVTCLNGGSCIKDTCSCLPGYEGQYCQTGSANKFCDSWHVLETGSISQFRSYVAYISQGNNRTSVMLDNIYLIGGFSVNANIIRDSIFINDQPLGSRRIIGIGKITTDSGSVQYNKINLFYKITDTLTMQVDDFGFNSRKISNASVWTR